MKSIRNFAKLASILLIASAVPSHASTQGTLGPTSTGTITINASITPEVQITALQDITFTSTYLRSTLSQGANALQRTAMCVWSNNPDKSYYITATGSGSGGAFTLFDGTRNLNYGVQVTDGSNSSNLTSGTKSAKLVTSAAVPNCGGGSSGQVLVTLSNSDLATMEATTTYTGVLTLLVSPT